MVLQKTELFSGTKTILIVSYFAVSDDFWTIDAAWTTVISSNFLVGKLCGNAQFP